MQTEPEPLLYAAFYNKTRFDFESELFDCAVIFCLERGEYEYSIGDLAGVSRPGEAVICPPGMSFHRRVIEPVDLHVMRFNLPTGTMPDAEKFRFRDFGRIKQDFAAIGQSGIKHIFTPSERHYLLDVWYTIQSERESRPKQYDPLMESVRLELCSKVSERFPMSELAAKVGLTPVALLRRFRKAFGQTPGEYLIEQRIRLAERLLCETDLPLAAIAAECGYENEYYFSTSFRKKVGVPPGLYRKSALV